MTTQEDVPVGQALLGEGRASLRWPALRQSFTTQHQVTLHLSTHRVSSLLLNPKLLQGLRQLRL